LFDQGVYAKAGGLPGGQIPIEFEYSGGARALNPHFILSTDPIRSSYSQVVTYRVDRVIKPEFKCEIERRMHAGIGQTSPSQAVNISWKEWMAMTTPYQGQRTAVKPGAPTITPATKPPGRLAPPPGISTMQFHGFSARPNLGP
jgi:hypothetical protein